MGRLLSKWNQDMDDLEAINKEIADDIVEDKASADDEEEEVLCLECGGQSGARLETYLCRSFEDTIFFLQEFVIVIHF